LNKIIDITLEKVDIGESFCFPQRERERERERVNIVPEINKDFP